MASISAYPPADLRTSRTRSGVVAAAVIAIGALVVWLTLHSTNAPTVSTTASAIAPVPVAAPPTPTAPASAALPEPPEVSEPASSAARPAPAPSPVRPKPAVRPAPVKKPTLSCDPPYFVDPQGIRHMRKECLK